MLYAKRLNNEYVATIRKAESLCEEDVQITKKEYNEILSLIESKPEDHDGIIYRLDDKSKEWIACEDSSKGDKYGIME